MKEIFISHSWQKDGLGRNNHIRSKTLCDNLKESGYSVWFDHYDMGHNIDNSIMKNISTCNVFIVCLTKTYCDKINSAVSSGVGNNCFKEWNYALYKKKTIIPVIMEPEMVEILNNNDGALQMYLNNLIYINITHDNYITNEFDLLCKLLRKHGVYTQEEKHIKDLKENVSFNSFLEYITEKIKSEKISISNIKVLREKTPKRNLSKLRFKKPSITNMIYI